MSTGPSRRITTFRSFARVARAEAWLALVEPVWPRGFVRLLGLVGIVEGVFLLLISGTAPVGEVGTLTLLAGETAFVASFAPAGRPSG
ncbi:hypothetical protein GCM10025867_22290 [Frondihabitans sucicola]|uniref:Uncharacterized protein n=1 Tax=Frondihabitans sucicola TaxID=1268041 RepID=A0ABM8GNH0_9MICO|nr:hypothetical protein [Frondihabitans sucicola]BDZ49988.1 hypothetical protein GCM10025867_22290 [Frondihabitans sucicola]